jgi:hypothetical protein
MTAFLKGLSRLPRPQSEKLVRCIPLPSISVIGLRAKVGAILKQVLIEAMTILYYLGKVSVKR